MTVSTISIDRTSLALAPLVIYGAKASGPIWFRSGDLTAPDWTFRTNYAPDSDWVPGRIPLSAVMDQAALVGVFTLGPAASGSDLATLRSTLEAALGQFQYDLTLTIGGVAEVWTAQASAVQYGDLAMRTSPNFTDFAAISIPVNP